MASSRLWSAAIGRPFFLARYLFSSSVGANQFPRLHRADRDTSHIHGTLDLPPRVLLLILYLPPLFKFNFSAECIENTLPPERHLVSFSFSSFSSFLESLSPHPLREEIFVFFLFFFRMLEKKFFCFEFHYSKRYRRARDLPRVFKKTVTSRWASPSRSESKSIEFERFRSKTCSTQIKGRELLYSLMRATARTSERSFSSEARRNIKLFFYKPRNTISIVSIKRFGLRRRRQQSSLGIVSPWPRFFEKNEKLEIKKGILRNVFFLINSNVIRGKDSSFQNEEKEQRDSIPEILFNETKYISLIVLLVLLLPFEYNGKIQKKKKRNPRISSPKENKKERK